MNDPLLPLHYFSPSILDLFSHIWLTLITTLIWVYVYRHRSFAFLALAMFFPGAFALAIHLCHGSLIEFVSFLLLNPQWSTVYWSLFASCLSGFLVILCCLINYLLGWGTFPSQTDRRSQPVHSHNRQLFYGCLRAMGEEIGWRSYLLPGLLSHFHPVLALNIVGICWGLYHVPVMILLSYHSQSEVPHPLRTILIQCASCWTSSFTYGWIAMQSQFSIVPSTMAHFVWNQINPRLLGSIYTNSPGWMNGEQWKINGEGLTGTIVHFLIALVIVIHLS